MSLAITLNGQQYPCDWYGVPGCFISPLPSTTLIYAAVSLHPVFNNCLFLHVCPRGSWLNSINSADLSLQGASFFTALITPSFSQYTFFPWESVGWREKEMGVAYVWWSEAEAQESERAACAVRENIVNVWMRRAAGHSGSRTQSYCISTGNLWEKMIYRLRERLRLASCRSLTSRLQSVSILV